MYNKINEKIIVDKLQCKIFNNIFSEVVDDTSLRINYYVLAYLYIFNYFIWLFVIVIIPDIQKFKYPNI